MNSILLKSLFLKHKEKSLFHRYIHNDHIKPLLDNTEFPFELDVIGSSVLGKPIYGVKLGRGNKKVLMWSQMHGNESTTTKALFDMFNSFSSSSESFIAKILDNCTLYIIPILNPDGAYFYTRENANKVDLNRDSQDLSQPESKVLRTVFNDFKPDFCFNLHGQRTIFSAGSNNKSATVSFLAPAQDKECTVTENRKIAMALISKMNEVLQAEIPDQVGVYDDSFNLNCVGDTFQSMGIPTVLFEAGHFKDDYSREEVRKFIYMSLLSSLSEISDENKCDYERYEDYFNIPENQKLFYDIIIRNANIGSKDSPDIVDLGINYKEVLDREKIVFKPILKIKKSLAKYYAHREIDAKHKLVLNEELLPLKLETEIDFVYIFNEKCSLKVN